jgi:hypothetical protein
MRRSRSRWSDHHRRESERMETLCVARDPARPGLMTVTLDRPAQLNAITTMRKSRGRWRAGSDAV